MKKGCAWAAGGAVVMFLLGWAAWAWISGQRQAKLTKELRLCREAGLPLVLPNESSGRGGRDGAVQLKQAIQSIRVGGIEDDIQMWLARPKAADDAVKLLKSNAKVIGLVEEFSTADRTSYLPPMSHEDWQLPRTATQFPSVITLFILDAEWESRHGDAMRAIETLFTATKAINLAAPPEDFRYLYERATESIRICDELGTLLKRHAANPRFLSEAKKLLAIIMPTPDIRKTVGRESAKGWAFVHSHQLSQEPEYDPNDGSAVRDANQIYVNKDVIWAMKVPSTRFSLLARYLKHYREWYSDLPLDPEDALGAMKATNAAEARLMGGGDRMTELVQMLSDRLVQQELPDIFTAVVNRRVLQVEVALLERYGCMGKWPRTLPNDLGIPLRDLFSGKPLKYVSTKLNFLVYSVGSDGIDNYGKSRRTYSPRPGTPSIPGAPGATGGINGFDIVASYDKVTKHP